MTSQWIMVIQFLLHFQKLTILSRNSVKLKRDQNTNRFIIHMRSTRVESRTHAPSRSVSLPKTLSLYFAKSRSITLSLAEVCISETERDGAWQSKTECWQSKSVSGAILSIITVCLLLLNCHYALSQSWNTLAKSRSDTLHHALSRSQNTLTLSHSTTLCLAPSWYFINGD